MHRVDAALSEWLRLYGLLRDAQTRLDAHRAGSAGASPDVDDLKREVARLQQETEHALTAMQTQFELMKKEQNAKK